MSQWSIGLAAVGGLVLLVSMMARPLKKTVLPPPIVGLAGGIILGPAVTGLLDPRGWGDEFKILEEASRLTLAIGLMGVALRLPPSFPKQHWKTLLLLLGLGMPLMALAGSLIVYSVLDLPWLVALTVGAILSPTDPVVATSVVTGKVAEDNISAPLRRTLSSESGLNDGLAYPLVLLPVLLLTREHAWSHWLSSVLLKEVGGGVLVGAAVGYLGGRLLMAAEQRHWMEKSSFLAATLALTLFVLGVARIIHIDGILAVFIAGLVFDQVVGGRERSQEEKVQEAVNQFFTLPIFILFGLMLPWDSWYQMGWKGAGLVVAVLLLRRLPFWLLFKPFVPEFARWKDAFLLGWFGPIGVAAIFYAMMVLHKTGNEQAWHLTSLLVFSSLLAHGSTAGPFTRLYGCR